VAAGERVISTDEMTGVQALERAAPGYWRPKLQPRCQTVWGMTLMARGTTRRRPEPRMTREQPLNQSHAGTYMPLRSADCGFHRGFGFSRGAVPQNGALRPLLEYLLEVGAAPPEPVTVPTRMEAVLA
jgi:hypothetical protein